MRYYTSIEQQLSQIGNEDKGRPRKRVLILGAGITGLTTGYELTKLGHKVQIYEASPRLGGRIWTHRFKNGQHGELGAMRIPASHDYTRHYISQFKLKLRPFYNYNPETFHDFQGMIYRAKEAGKNIPNIFHLSQQDRDSIKNANGLDENVLDTIYLRIIKIILSYLDDADKAQLFGHGPLSDKLNYLDKSVVH